MLESVVADPGRTMPHMIIAIDGPAASGKSTVARSVARRLGFAYLDTGAMYRAVAVEALAAGVALDDAQGLATIAREADITFERAPGDPVYTRILVDGRDVTREIRTPAADAAVARVARVPYVRHALVQRQRAMAGGCDTVVEGRDIGSVVFPDAEVKVFLTASPEERARRRHGDRTSAGHASEVAEVVKDIAARDTSDSTRDVGPLMVAPDAIEIDTTHLSIEAVVDQVVDLARRASR